MRHNRSFDTDAQVRPCALRTRFPCAGQVRRYASLKRLLCTVAAMCVACHASAAADTEWLPAAPAALGPRTSWQSSPAAAFVEVAVSKFGLAQALLSERPFVLRSPAEVTSLLSPRQSFTCGAGSQPYLVRAVYSGNGAFSL
jgi:hypothetical protein